MGCDSGVELDVVAGTHTPASRQWATHGSEVRPPVAFAFVRPSFVHFAYAHTTAGIRRVRLGLGRVTSSGAHKGGSLLPMIPLGTLYLRGRGGPGLARPAEYMAALPVFCARTRSL